MAQKNDSSKEDRQTRKRATAAYSDAVPSGENVAASESTKVESDTEPEAVEIVEDVSAELEALKTEVATLKTQSAEYLDAWQRERADFQNYRKRQERDQVLQRNSITGEIVKRYLVILDDLELALRNKPQENNYAGWADGIELICRKLQGILDAEGVVRIESESNEFDPNIHEAITHEDSPDHSSGQIIEIIQQGYKLGDRVLRPARVRVAR